MIAAAAHTLTGCSVIPSAEPADVYQLAPATTTPSWSNASLPYSLAIETPHSGRMIDSNRILVMPQATELSVYKNARWGDTVPTQLRNRFTRALRESAALRAVGNDRQVFSSDISLGSEITAFQVEYTADGPQAVVSVDAYLTDTGSHRLLATRSLTYHMPLADPSVASAVRALSAASDAVTQSLVAWVLQQLQQQQ
jgi:cholesterol transport system auxiliary component